MNYKNIYNLLIEKAKARTLENVYTENHHIIPKSLGGTNDTTNLVCLTAKEHFVAHHLLWKIYRNPQMTKAFMLMCNTKRDGIKYKICAIEYASLKEDNRKFRSEFMTGRIGNNLGKKLPQEWRDNIGNGQRGISKGKGNPSSFKGKSHSAESKKAISESRKGVGTHFTPHSEETKQLMRENRKGKTKAPWTEERKAARRKLLAEKFSQEKSPD